MMLKRIFHIRLADDDEDDHYIFSTALHEINESIELTSFFHSDSLMNYLNGNDCTIPGIIFLDYNMPGCDGIDCLKQIKQQSNFSHIPTIIYSTSSSLVTQSEAMQYGAYKFMVSRTALQR